MPKGVDRTRRIGEQIRRELASEVGHVLDHPHAGLLSFTAVKVTRDLSYAKVYVTHVLSDPEERQTLISALNRASGAFRHHLAKSLTTRKVPELSFHYDESVEYGARMDQMLKNLVHKSGKTENDAS